MATLRNRLFIQYRQAESRCLCFAVFLNSKLRYKPIANRGYDCFVIVFVANIKLSVFLAVFFKGIENIDKLNNCRRTAYRCSCSVLKQKVFSIFPAQCRTQISLDCCPVFVLITFLRVIWCNGVTSQFETVLIAIDIDICCWHNIGSVFFVVFSTEGSSNPESQSINQNGWDCSQRNPRKTSRCCYHRSNKKCHQPN